MAVKFSFDAITATHSISGLGDLHLRIVANALAETSAADYADDITEGMHVRPPVVDIAFTDMMLALALANYLTQRDHDQEAAARAQAKKPPQEPPAAAAAVVL